VDPIEVTTGGIVCNTGTAMRRLGMRVAGGSLAANGFTQVTSPPARYRSFPAWLAVGSLDKAFVRGAIAVRQTRIVKTSLSKTASDHLPLVVDFHLA
ncbi:MAG: endonuclease/exonuclease/phosphatase family protein, partial [Planctomycetia bacterium]